MQDTPASFEKLHDQYCTGGKSPAPQLELFYDTLANTSTVDSDRLCILRILWHWKELLISNDVMEGLPFGLYTVIKESDSSDVLVYAMRFVAYILHTLDFRNKDLQFFEFFYIGVEDGDEDQAELLDCPKIFEQLCKLFETHPMDTPMRTWAAAALTLVKLNVDDSKVHKASGVISQALICRVSRWTTSSRTVRRTKDTLAEMGCLMRAFRDILWAFRNIPSKYASSVLLAFGCIKCVCTHPLLRTLFPEVIMQVDKVEQDIKVEDEDVLDQLGQDALNHCVQYGDAYTLQDISLSKWARICRCIDQKRAKPVVPSPLPYPKPRTMNTIPDFSGEPVRFQSQQGDTLYVHPALLVSPLTGFMQGNTGRCIIFDISTAALTIVVQSQLCTTVTPEHLHPYSCEQLLEGLEAAEQYQLTDLAHSLAARLTELLIRDGLSVEDMCNTWLRVKRPHLEYPMHAGLVDWCVEQLAQPCKVNELCDYLRTRREDEDEEGDSSAETDDATESVGSKRKHQEMHTSPSSKRRRHAGLGEDGIPADDGSQQGSKPFLPLLVEDIANKFSVR